MLRQAALQMNPTVGGSKEEDKLVRLSSSLGTSDSGIQEAFVTVRWGATQRVLGLATVDLQTLWRAKARKLSLWNRASLDRTCVHQECATVSAITLGHILWDCPYAKVRWRAQLSHWEGSDLVFLSPFQSIFGLTLPAISAATLSTILATGVSAPTDDILAALPSIANAVWKYECAATIGDIWRHRNEVLRGDQSTVHSAIGRQRGIHSRSARHLGRLFAVHGDDTDSTAAVRCCWMLQSALSSHEPGPSCVLVSSSVRYLLFFDGGSRGNPDPGGSGSVIVQLQTSGLAIVKWVASMAFGRSTTTNSYAEYQGLLHGLQCAWEQGWPRSMSSATASLSSNNINTGGVLGRPRYGDCINAPHAWRSNSRSQRGVTTIEATTKWRIRLPMTQWIQGDHGKFT